MKEGIKAVHPLMNRVERAEGAKIVNSGGSNHHIPFTGRSTGGYRTIKIWKSPRKIRATEFDFVDIRNECPSLVTPSIRITKNLLMDMLVNVAYPSLSRSSSISFFFRHRMSRSTFSEKRKNARNESVEDDN